MSAELVTIYIPTHGRPHLVTRALSSALRQTYSPVEVVVAIDGPDVATERALHQWSDDKRVQIIRGETQAGACAARNAALRVARGSYATGLDDDDEIRPEHVAGLLTALNSGRAAFSCTTSLLRRPGGDNVRHAFSGPITLDGLLHENVIGNQVLTKTASLLAVGGYDISMPAWQDYDLWVRLCHRFGSGIRVDRRSYVQHLDHEQPRISNAERIAEAHRLFVEKHAPLLNERHRISLELLMFETSHRRFPWSKLIEYSKAGFARRAAAAFLSDRISLVRSAGRLATRAS